MDQHTLTLKMKNYRRFAETGTITFQPGLTIISGQNGAGKSTLIEAFLYALFGPKVGSKSGQRADEIRTDSLSGPIYVECQLHIDDQEVHIIRSGSMAELRINSVVQVQSGGGSSKAVTTRVTALLGGLARKQFERTYVALQGDTAGLVVEDASKRRDIIEKVLQMEVLTQAIELQTKKSDMNKGEVISFGKTICDALFLDTEIRELIQSFQGARTANTRSPYTQKFLKRIEQSVTEHQQGQREAAQEIMQAQEAVQATTKKRKDHQAAIEGADQLYKKLGERKEKYDEYQAKILFVHGQREQSEKDIQKYLNDLEVAERYAEEATEYSRLQQEIENCVLRLQRLPLIKNCYVASIQAKNEVDTLDDQLHELATVEEELNQAKEQAENAKKHEELLRNNDPTQADDASWQRQRGGLDREVTQNKEALQQLEDGVNNAHCPTCNQLLSGHTREQRIQHLTLWFNETLPSLQEQLQEQKLHINTRKAEWEREKKQAETMVTQCQKMVTIAEMKGVKRETLCEQRKKAQPILLEKQHAWLELGEDVPDPQEEATLQKRKAGRTKQAELLKDHADQSILGVQFAGEDFQYLDASHIAYPISRLSGGEKSLVGLCLRIALAEQAQTITRMGRVKFLVLDEVLSSLDEERSESVKRIFADVLQRGIFEHIIMITHLDTVKQSWPADGLAVQKDGKISTVISASPGEIPLDVAEE